MTRALAILVATAFLFTACDKDKEENNKVTVVRGSGNVEASLQQFRELLGGSLNTTPGVTGGFREVNWESVPDELVGKTLPDNFFNTPGTEVPASRQRGLAYNPGSGEFRVSATNFKEVNNSVEGEFAAFSGNKTFANVSTNLWDIEPQVPGQAEAATIRAFGVVFSDVDLANSTSLEFFSGEKSLGKYFAPVHNSENSFSFLGVYFKDEKVTSVKVRHQGFLAAATKDLSDGGTDDLVILDNFIYDEPVKK